MLVFQRCLASRSLVWAAELELVQECPVELVDLARLGRESGIVTVRIVVLALHVEGLGARIADDVLAGLALDRLHDDELACGTDEVLVYVGVRENGREPARGSHAADGGRPNV